MEEITGDPIYEILAKEYEDLLLDYAVIGCNEDYLGEGTHRDAVKVFLSLLGNRRREDDEDFDGFTFDEQRMSCQKYDVKEFFSTDGGQLKSPGMSYWRAFSDPPYPLTCGKNGFKRINAILFPEDHRDALEIFTWNNDFSDYFDEGKEWWGTALWSIYDKQAKRFVLIGASLTD